MAEVYCDREVMRYIPGGALPDTQSVMRLLETYARAQTERGFSSWAVVERAGGTLIGDAGLGIFAPTGEVELGYTLARAYWGRGYATEAAGAALAAGRKHLDVPRIIAVVDVDNAASLRVPPRLGMSEVGKIDVDDRPHVMFAASCAG
jgi:ribosomal-protein-alanine N-acetyltransferase